MTTPESGSRFTPTIPRPYTRIAKAVVVGDAAVGKTSLLVRYIKGIFNPSYILTIGVSFFVRDVVVGDEVLRVQLWDTGGQERFGPIRQLYYRGTKGVLLVFDRTNPESFKRLGYWLDEIRRGCGEVPTVVVGNKADLPAAVPAEEARRFADEHRLVFVETSAKTDLNTDKAFSTLAGLILNQISKGSDASERRS
jgi:Ras-related protein Rab-2A